METRANYILIGSFTLLVSAFLLGFALWAAKFSSDASWHRYQVTFNEPITGLTEGSAVQYSGISVGTIESLNLDSNDPRRVHAILRIRRETPIKVDTRAKFSQPGLTSNPIIQLSGGSPEAASLIPDSREDIPVIQTEPSALQNISDTATRLVDRLDKAFSEENIAHISAIIEGLRKTTDTVAGQDEEIRQLIVNARGASGDLRKTLQTSEAAMARLDRDVLARLPATLEKLDRAIAALEATGQNANALVSENRAPLQRFTQDGLQQVAPTLEELRSLMRELRQMSSQLGNNPAGYLLGHEQPKEFTPK